MNGGRALALVCAAVLILAAPLHAGADEAPTLVPPNGAAWLSLPPSRAGPFPAVLILSDRTGPDGREVPYADYLLAAGIAVVQLDSDAPEEAAPLLTQSGLRALVHHLAPGHLDPERIGILGFGTGGRAALAASEVPVAALYPACGGLAPSLRSGPTLLLYPDDTEETVACLRVDPRAEAVGTATHGWDHGQGLWAGGTAMLPHPDGSRARLFARSDGRATKESVARVVRYFRNVFGTASRRGLACEVSPVTRSGQPQRPLLSKKAVGAAVRLGRKADAYAFPLRSPFSQAFPLIDLHPILPGIGSISPGKVTQSGCRPSRIASTISSASNDRRSRREV
jgi:dienelactone hydrolase